MLTKTTVSAIREIKNAKDEIQNTIKEIENE
jgi:hypothetical protein